MERSTGHSRRASWLPVWTKLSSRLGRGARGLPQLLSAMRAPPPARVRSSGLYDGQGDALSLLFATEQQSRRASSEHPLAVEIDACRRIRPSGFGDGGYHGLL